MTAPGKKLAVLYIEQQGFEALPASHALDISATGAEVISVVDKAAALIALDSLTQDAGTCVAAVVANAPDFEIFAAARKNLPKAKTVLVTDAVMEGYSASLRGQEPDLIDHVIANRLPMAWTTHELRVTLQKLIQRDIFGVEKYLIGQTPVRTVPITGSADRETYNYELMQFAEKCRLGQYVGKLVFGITEELLMNALYDAPSAAGIADYDDIPRTTRLDLKPEHHSTLSYGFDGRCLALGVRDPFGALQRDKLYHYIRKVLRRSDSANLIDTKKGGAGLGLFKILYSSHALICNVDPGKQTEVIALIDTENQVRDFAKMTRSIHYFATS